MKNLVRRFSLAVPIGLSLIAPVYSQTKPRPPVLDIPIRCTFGQDCFVQHYIDTDSSKNAADYTCGSLTYNNHRGTDIRVKTIAHMEKNVPVIAAENGQVANLRRGIKDQYFSDYSKKKKKEIFNIGLGNAVILSHGNGWETYYAHLKKGSITVKKGDKVRKGDLLGYVGMSGLTDFPHVHFELRKNNSRIDPFSSQKMNEGPCGTIQKTYWSKTAREKLVYSPTGFMATGLSGTRPHNRKDLETGRKAQTDLNSDAPTLFFWSYYIGSRKGDKVSLKLVDPDGQILAQNTLDPMPKHQISRVLFIGKKRPPSGWKSGMYRGEIQIERDGINLRDSAIITIR